MLPVADYKSIRSSQDQQNHRFYAQGNWFESWETLGKVRIQLLVFLGALVVALFGVQLVFASSLATDGQKLAQISQQIARFEAENNNLKGEIAKESSLSALSQKAESLGFTRPAKIITP